MNYTNTTLNYTNVTLNYTNELENKSEGIIVIIVVVTLCCCYFYHTSLSDEEYNKRLKFGVQRAKGRIELRNSLVTRV